MLEVRRQEAPSNGPTHFLGDRRFVVSKVRHHSWETALRSHPCRMMDETLDSVFERLERRHRPPRSNVTRTCNLRQRRAASLLWGVI